jgi:uracil phosphoribosyltransferase
MPRENIIAGAVDKGLDAKKYIVPGLGDFGDRYFGTL